MTPAELERHHEQLEEILARPEFRSLPRRAEELPGFEWPSLPAFPDWLAQHLGAALQTLVDLFARLYRAPDPTRPGGDLGALVWTPGTWLLVAAVAAALGLALLRLRRQREAAASSAPAAAAVDADEAPLDPLVRSADEWRRFALEFEGRGEWRLALRALYLRLLVLLHERGAVRYERQRTNGEYARDLRGRPGGDAFAALTRAFDYAWYGARPFGADDYARAVDAAGEVDRATRPQTSAA